MTDVKVAAGALGTAGSAMAGWVQYIEPGVSLLFTVIVGSLTAWYTWERAMKLRKERKDAERNSQESVRS